MKILHPEAEDGKGTEIGKTILLVEDEEADVELTLMAFEMNRIAVEMHVARDGQEALDYVFGLGDHAGRDTAVQPWLVLLDLNLPKIGGMEVLKRLRNDQRTSLVQVIVLTSSDRERDKADAYALGASQYLRKPTGFDDFLEMIRLIANKWID